MLLDNIADILKSFGRTPRKCSPRDGVEQPVAALKSIGYDEFLAATRNVA
jgi:hypothetical protein